jgi:gas vesicle protein
MNNKSGFFGFLAGVFIGSIATLLYAPRSGDETRQLLAENSQEIKEKALKSIQEVQDSALTAIEQAQGHAEALNQEAKERIAKMRQAQAAGGNGHSSEGDQLQSEEIAETQAA